MWLEDEDDWFCAETLAGHASTVWEASFNADGKYLVSCSEDKSIIIWQYTEPQRKPTSMDVYDVYVIKSRKFIVYTLTNIWNYTEIINVGKKLLALMIHTPVQFTV